MSDVSPVPAGREGLIPHLVCSPAAAAIEFYKKAFGAEEIMRMAVPGDTRLMHAEMTLDGHPFFLVDDFPEMCGGKSESATALGGTPVTLHHYVKDCDAVIRQAAAAGAEVVMSPEDMFWGDRYGQVRDPFGHRWSFATKLGNPTIAEMQQAMMAGFAQGQQG